MPDNYWKGKRSPNAKLPDRRAEQIRDEYKRTGLSWERLGKKYNVSKRTVGRIIHGEYYSTSAELSGVA